MKRIALIVSTALLVPALVVAAGKYRDDQSPGSAADVEAGKTMYAMCAGCHGLEGEGKVGIAPRLNSDSYLAVVSNDFLKRTILEGRPGTNMIPWAAAVQENGADKLVAYMRSWQQSDGVPLNSEPLAGDMATGEEMYSTICSRCHGKSGAGYQESAPGTGIGRKGFLDQISDGELRAIIKMGKDNTPMRPHDKTAPTALANLSDEEIDSVIQYLRSKAW